ncbi:MULTISPECIES: hypothetical protein [unclassified Cellulomonas]|uniref:hypothetical protein n=1 Tax=unclassified Cellulomonas TaxID=2620175 RepID=UPI0024B8102C|nr:hypothetical protein [Cellulomonas sp. ES6]WHP17199.1 hypothetical protein P9841_16685 [Cellulomonas sp. ES6]
MPTSPRRRAVVVACAAVAVLVAGALAWWLTRPGAEPAAAPSPVTTTPAPTPATPRPGPSGEPSAPAPESPDPAAPTEPAPAPTGGTPGQPAGPAAVDVVATYAAWNPGTAAVEVGAYAATVESGGRCTLTLTGPGGTATIGVDAVPDASTTVCPGMSLSGPPLTSGTWEAVVTYSSPALTGASDPLTVEVP